MPLTSDNGALGERGAAAPRAGIEALARPQGPKVSLAEGVTQAAIFSHAEVPQRAHKR